MAFVLSKPPFSPLIDLGFEQMFQSFQAAHLSEREIGRVPKAACPTKVGAKFNRDITSNGAMREP